LKQQTKNSDKKFLKQQDYSSSVHYGVKAFLAGLVLFLGKPIFFKELVLKQNLCYFNNDFKNTGSRPKGAFLAGGLCPPAKTSLKIFSKIGSRIINSEISRIINYCPLGIRNIGR